MRYPLRKLSSYCNLIKVLLTCESLSFDDRKALKIVKNKLEDATLEGYNAINRAAEIFQEMRTHKVLVESVKETQKLLEKVQEDKEKEFKKEYEFTHTPFLFTSKFTPEDAQFKQIANELEDIILKFS